MLEFTLPFGIEVDLIALATPLAPFRPYLAAFIWLAMGRGLVDIAYRAIGMRGSDSAAAEAAEAEHQSAMGKGDYF